MRAFFSAADGTQDNAFTLDLQPEQFSGARSAFGAYMLISGLLESDPAKARRLEIGGILPGPARVAPVCLSRASLPAAVRSGSSRRSRTPSSRALRIVAPVESPNLEITLTALAVRGDGRTATYRLGWAPQSFSVPRDRWKGALAACGHGRIHIVELPVPPEVSDAWARSAQMLSRASVEFGEGRYGETMGNARTALQELVGVLERSLGLEPATAFAQRVKVVGEALTALHGRRSTDPYAVLSSVIRAVADFSSDPVHRGYDIPNREDAAFALSLATALHAFLARRPIPKPTLASDAPANDAK